MLYLKVCACISWCDQVALFGVKTVRFLFDIFSGYAFGPINEGKLLKRILFLETVRLPADFTTVLKETSSFFFSEIL